MKKLTCDICGGMLEMQAGGEKCFCSCCGMSYAIERVKEIYSGMKVSVTGSDADVKQWKTLAEMYIDSLDFQSAIPVVRKILEAVPDDTYAKEMYDYLQESQYFEIKDRVLIKYTGCVHIPQERGYVSSGHSLKRFRNSLTVVLLQSPQLSAISRPLR